MLPTALPYHTPAKLSRAFFVRRHTTGQQRQGSSPTPRPPQGGSATSGVWRQGKPAVYRHPKNCTAALDNNKRLWYSIGATDGVWRESVRTSKRANPRGLALFLFAPAGRPMQRPHGACWAVTAKGMGCPLLPSSSPHPTACGPTPSHPRGWAPRRFRSLRSLHKGAARGGTSAALHPDRRHSGGWARGSRSTHQAPPPGRSRLRRCPCRAAWPRCPAARSVAP